MTFIKTPPRRSHFWAQAHSAFSGMLRAMRMSGALRAVPAVGVVLLVAGCQQPLPPIFEKQNACFVEAGKPPINSLNGGHILTEDEAAIFNACMARP